MLRNTYARFFLFVFFFFFDVGENTGSDESVGTCGNPFVTTRGRQCVTYNAHCTMKRDYVKKKKRFCELIAGCVV